jgi:3-deoxy-D-arabino-heptulosonate 7-phosphate (DAHP) synthase
MREIFELILHRIRDLEVQRGEFSSRYGHFTERQDKRTDHQRHDPPSTFRVIAGPCTVESYEQYAASAKAVKQAGFEYVRGGAFKPRTSPYSFQGSARRG